MRASLFMEKQVNVIEEDNKLISLLFDYMYEKGGCDDLGKMLMDNYHIQLTENEMFRIYYTALATGYVSNRNWVKGSHQHIYLNQEGVKMLTVYGNYLAFLGSKKQEINIEAQIKKLTKDNMKLTNWKIIILFIVSAISLIISIVGIFSTYKETKTLKELLHKVNTEIQK